MLRGIDVSGYDGKNLNFAKVKELFDFAIIKCGGQEDAGYSVYRHAAYTTHIANARAAGLQRIGHYWFNGIGATVRAGAEAFANYAQSIDSDILVLDCEGYRWNGIAKPQWNPAECLEFFVRLKELKPNNPLYLYINRSTENSQDWNQIVALEVKLWVADYGLGTKPAGTKGADPRIVHWPHWDIWQYDSRGGGDGINAQIGSARAGANNLDVNEAREDAWAIIPIEPTPAPVPNPTPDPTHRFNVGDRAVLNGSVFRDSAGNGQGASFKNHSGSVTIYNAGSSHPYHIDGLGWVADSELSIAGNTPAPVATSIVIGSKVQVTGSNYATGQLVPGWVKRGTHTVGQLAPGKALLKEINSWVYLKNLKKV